ncbi:sensor histidine kinase [Streptomyces yaizuensis]|uniref:Sensor histidine kinase n=1 Tax=Streptomyces yaizuensis TaxID=2989713 RepID=A0ABQ5PAV8_9ACTN|nr:sensor histidine kinase [Streptomyces sp. YSPA8]GLF99620.1 sensor histidine kinase [Streptomyces sp. YSPA8]
MTMTVEERWTQFFRYGPYALLGLATLLAAVSPLVMTRREIYAAGVLLLAALALQTWWSRLMSRPRPAAVAGPAAAGTVNVTGTGTGQQAGTPALPSGTGTPVLPAGTAGRVHFTLRTALAFALTWLNPFFAIYACLGYLDAAHLLPPRAARAGFLVTAVAVAGSQSGGLPPESPMQWVLFGTLIVFNAMLALGLGHLSDQQDEKAGKAEERARTIAALEKALAENAALHAQLVLQAREAGVADERRRLAAEIHDTIAQGLTGIITQLQVVASTTDQDVAREHLDRAQALARRSLGEARRSVHNLHPAALEHDTLAEALRKTVGEWSGRTGVTARLTVTGTEEPLHDEVAATLLRIAQEALANTARHARATRAGVTLSYMDDEVTLDVRDDGHGFDPLAAVPRTGSGGFGLDGMRARAERIAGTVTVESEIDQGTAISARVPLVRHD